MQISTEEMARRVATAKKVSPWLNTQMAAFYVHLTASGLEKMRRKGSGPQFSYHGRYVRYHIDDLDIWSRARKGTTAYHRKIQAA